ncbi:MAG: P-II family nitrogen regulator, partial [Actinobacteria bacterium]|nr:P-II family nitrogen regulator [Actinomycetota bacterium]
LGAVAERLESSGFKGFTISDVRGHGQSPERQGEWRGQAYELHVTHKLEISVIVEDAEVQEVVKAIVEGARTGQLGDGLVTVSDIVATYQIRTCLPAASGNGATIT